MQVIPYLVLILHFLREYVTLADPIFHAVIYDIRKKDSAQTVQTLIVIAIAPP
jgi:hypothetical protein